MQISVAKSQSLNPAHTRKQTPFGQGPNIESKTPLRWAGSKKKIINELARRVPEKYNRYIEPFCGSACLHFKLQPEKSILSDINPDLINFYKVWRKLPGKLFDMASSIPRDAANYYNLRSKVYPDGATIKRAVRFFYLNRLCFNGVYRTNNSGRFNVPMGKNTGDFPGRDDFIRASKSISRADILCCQYRHSLKLASVGDFIYLDPPYATFGVSNRGEYGPKSFQSTDMPDLLRLLSECETRGASFMLSYSNSPDLIKHAKQQAWNVSKIKVLRNVAGFSADRNTVNELIISNY